MLELPKTIKEIMKEVYHLLSIDESSLDSTTQLNFYRLLESSCKLMIQVGREDFKEEIINTIKKAK